MGVEGKGGGPDDGPIFNSLVQMKLSSVLKKHKVWSRAVTVTVTVPVHNVGIFTQTWAKKKKNEISAFEFPVQTVQL